MPIYSHLSHAWNIMLSHDPKDWGEAASKLPAEIRDEILPYLRIQYRKRQIHDRKERERKGRSES